MKFSIVAAVAALLAAPAQAHDYRVGDLLIEHPVAGATLATAMTAAGYLTITNTGTTADRLLSIDAPFARSMIHATEIVNDVATMSSVEALDIPAGTTVTFAPGNMHVMFMGLDGDPLEPGEEFSATLTFETAGAVEVIFKVEDLVAQSPHDEH